MSMLSLSMLFVICYLTCILFSHGARGSHSYSSGLVHIEEHFFQQILEIEVPEGTFEYNSHFNFPF